MIAFGPVPSRRLGRSLGINNVPIKGCPYSCAYCQLGRTIHREMEPRVFFAPREIFGEVQEKLLRLKEAGGAVDYLTFVPHGEPTLDENLGQAMDRVRELGVKVAVITNGALLWRPEVRERILGADLACLKVDAADERTWREINRPHPDLKLAQVLEGMRAFARSFAGELTTETMLVEGANDGEAQVAQVVGFLAAIAPARAYIAVPTRPPAERWARAPADAVIQRAHQQMASRLGHVECHTGHEGTDLIPTGNPADDILSIASVHPIRQDAMDAFLRRSGADWGLVRQLVDQEQLSEMEFGRERFYVRRMR
jgi:wyosine [tRNA(Phe)-imidazoG37] synthetase (radical SAM superfamily)